MNMGHVLAARKDFAVARKTFPNKTDFTFKYFVPRVVQLHDTYEIALWLIRRPSLNSSVSPDALY